MRLLKTLLFALLVIVSVSWLTNQPWFKKYRDTHQPAAFASSAKPNNLAKLKSKAEEARSFVKQKKYNEQICFLIEMNLPSGQNRFFIYDLKKDSVVNAGLVAHGNCFQYWLEGRKYNNVVGGGCTSLGKYRIGGSYQGKFGYSYKLYGLDTSNNNAFERTVVLHSHSCVPESPTADEICQSNGCPTVSPGFLEALKPIINRSGKPVLLWIFE